MLGHCPPVVVMWGNKLDSHLPFFIRLLFYCYCLHLLIYDYVYCYHYCLPLLTTLPCTPTTFPKSFLLLCRTPANSFFNLYALIGKREIHSQQDTDFSRCHLAAFAVAAIQTSQTPIHLDHGLGVALDAQRCTCGEFVVV